MKKQSTPSAPEPGLRLNKAIAQSGLASRRAADALILDGRVTVNNVIITEPGTRVAAKDVVAVDGAPLAQAATGEHCYVMLNKPVQVVSTARDPEGRQTVLDLLPPQYAGKRLYPVGRLDYFSEGLLLLTDDGELTLRLTHPRYHQPKVYRVRLKEKPSPAALEAMRSGMTLAEGEKLAPVGARLIEEGDGGRGHVLEMTLNQGLNRQIRRMCRDLNLTILKLVRISSGPLSLDDLPPGAARELTKQELAALKRSVGL